MFNGENGYSLADIAAATNNGNGFGGDGSAWWIIILFLFAFAGGWGNGGLFGGNGNATGSGITDGYILTSDFASLERQMENGFDRIAQQGNQIANGLSSLGYDQLNQMNNINTNITALGNQMQSCCCENKTIALQNAAELNYRLAEQSCQTRQAVADATAAITVNQDANTRSILEFLTQNKIASLEAENQTLKFAASQQAQNNYLVGALNPSPVPAYVVPNPYAGTLGCGCNLVG